MRWPWSNRGHEAEPLPTDVDEATEARVNAEQALRDTIERSGEVRKVSEASRRHGRVNHFAQLISDTFRGV